MKTVTKLEMLGEQVPHGNLIDSYTNHCQWLQGAEGKFKLKRKVMLISQKRKACLSLQFVSEQYSSNLLHIRQCSSMLIKCFLSIWLISRLFKKGEGIQRPGRAGRSIFFFFFGLLCFFSLWKKDLELMQQTKTQYMKRKRQFKLKFRAFPSISVESHFT